jgi:hypothetical protein
MLYYISGSTVIDNDGGTMKANGLTDNDKFNTTTTPRKDVGVFGSSVIDGSDTNAALTLGIFAYNNSRPIGKKITTKINTTTNSVLLSGALIPSLIQSIKKIKVCNNEGCFDGVRTLQTTKAIRNNQFNIYTGKFNEGFPLSGEDFYEEDKEANVNRTNSGGFVYTIGVSNVNKNYPSKTG